MNRKQQEADAGTASAGAQAKRADADMLLAGQDLLKAREGNQTELERQSLANKGGLAQQMLSNEGGLAQQGLRNKGALDERGMINTGATDILNRGAILEKEKDNRDLVKTIISGGGEVTPGLQQGYNQQGEFNTDLTGARVPAKGSGVNLEYVKPERDTLGAEINPGFFYDKNGNQLPADMANPAASRMLEGGQQGSGDNPKQQPVAGGYTQEQLDDVANRYSQQAEARTVPAAKKTKDDFFAQFQGGKSTEGQGKKKLPSPVNQGPVAVPSPDQEGARALSEAQQLQEDLRISKRARRKKEIDAMYQRNRLNQ
jgi:hypothetical protein